MEAENSATSVVETSYFERVKWRGYETTAELFGGGSTCIVHDWHPVDHYGQLGTGFIQCGGCGSVATDPRPADETDQP